MLAGAPLHHDDWPALAATAEALLDARVKGDPQHVEAGTFTQAQADDRARVMGALVTQWRAVVDHAPMPKLEATEREMRADLARVSEGSAIRVSRRPDDRPTVLHAERILALVWWQGPWTPEFPTSRIQLSHSVNEALRTRAAEKHRRAA